jgi:serine phosphatase RsbU (regulator of sigma subunit)
MSGDRFILYTDGLIEVFNSQDRMLGVEGFAGLVRDSAHLPLPEMRQSILNGVTSWTHRPFADDVSLPIVEIR